MISNSPEQELYDAAYAALSGLGCAIYTHSPPPGTKMPYIQMGSTQVVPDYTKTKLMATGYLGFDVWGAPTDRGEISGKAIRALRDLSLVKNTGSFRTEMRLSRSSYEVLADQSTEDDLWRARVSTEWAINAP